MNLSIIIPAYNAERFLAEAIESVISQKNVDSEIIVVDDGSTDSTAEIVSRYPSVEYVYKPNGGAASARNLGVSLAHGNYIMYLDADDYLENDYICSRALQYAENQNYDMVIFQLKMLNNTTKTYKIPYDYSRIEVSSDLAQSIENMISGGLFPASPCFRLIKRSIAKDILFPEGTIAEDIQWFTEVLLRVRSLGFLNEPGYVYRKNISSSVTGSFDQKKCEDLIKIIEESALLVSQSIQTEVKNAIYSGLAYEYAILLVNSYPYRKKFRKEINALSYLLKYHMFPKVKYIDYSVRLFGTAMTARLLRVYNRRRSISKTV